MSTTQHRVADYPIDSLFLQRWSARALTGESISEAELFTILEAARWAPSSYNSQPWRFIYARRDTAAWGQLLGLLNDFNRSWAAKASALVILVSKTTMLPPGATTEVASRSHSFDAGAPWANLALQAARSGWAAHAMVGFDATRAARELAVPVDHSVEVAIAIGRPGDPASLPDALRAREFPSGRVKLSQIVGEGRFPAVA